MEEGEKTRITVDIYGQTYTIVGSDTAAHVRQVASLVDDRMRELRARNPYLDTTKVAVLTAVNSVHDYLKLQTEKELLEQELKKLKG
ncbi:MULTISPECIES: cell division protein ZapA [Sporosarcina]|uniref:cell division protein ZapA n=1 Tax=Sporosarcina TaxID=1569 RepID=UPI00058B8D43|nr:MULTISPECIES: cell division protein ZapA [Sporosarcina]WJY28026.1 cell division protein ZapA [Sporosarcina sp. 0.2-SM1T-5]